MKKILFLLTALSLVNVHAAELVTLKDYLKKELAGAAKISKETLPVKPEDKAKLSAIASNAQDTEFVFYYAKDAAEKIVKACTVVPQQGKEGPMTVGVCFSPAGLVQSVTLLSSEEERGKVVAEQSFLKQFNGKKISDAFQVGQDVNGVSGATWSSKAVSEALRKSSFAFKNYVGGKK